MDLKYCKNIGENTYELLLIGEVGKDINGREIASEILYLNSIGAKIIKERINTIGGTIIDAFSIVSANVSSEAEIHTVNEGIADSSGSFILASGTRGKRSAFDFATMKVHNTSYKGQMLEDMEDGPLKDELIMMRDSIVTILANNSGKTKEEVTNMMNEGTRMTAEDALNFGFIDAIISSTNTPEIVENMSMAELMNVCREFNDKNKPIEKQENKMETVLNFLNLSKEASEASALTAVQDISKKATDAEGKVENLNTEITNLKNEATQKDSTITELQNKVKEFETKEVENAVKTAIDSGKFSEDNKDELITQCTAQGVENFNKMVEMVKLPQANVVNQINNGGGDGTKVTADEKLAAEYQELAEKDPMKLEEIKNLEPTRFEKMFKAWNK
jgi:ATP-dependent Clp protease protease subunit